jgi:ferredoxin
MIATLRETCRQLLSDGKVDVVIGYGCDVAADADSGTPVFPVFITKPEDAERLVWNDRCHANLTAYLKREEIRSLGRAAVVVKGCDQRSLVVLEKESQLDRAQLYVIGVACEGLGQPKCRTCDVHEPRGVDVVIKLPPPAGSGGGSEDKMLPPPAGTGAGGEGKKLPSPSGRGAGGEGKKLPSPSGRGAGGEGGMQASAANNTAISPHPSPLPEGDGDHYAELRAFLARPAAERLAHWRQELARCVKCYACRQVCPMCYCRRCIVDKNRPRAISTSATLKGNFAWHIARAFHLAGRCIGCEECSRACPMGIDLRLLNLSLAKAAEDDFGFRAGVDPAAEPLIGSFAADDKEDFIR